MRDRTNADLQIVIDGPTTPTDGDDLPVMDINADVADVADVADDAPEPTPLPAAPATTRLVAEFNENELRAEQLAEKTVCFDIQFKFPSFRRKINPAQIMERKLGRELTDAEVEQAEREAQKNPAYFSASKALIDLNAWRDVTRPAREFKAWLALRAVKCTMLRGGIFMIPLELVDAVDTKIQEVERATKALLDLFLTGQYDALRDAAKNELGDVWCADDYPLEQDIRDAVKITYRFRQFNVAAAIAKINNKIYEQERAKAEREWADTAGEIRDALRQSFADLVGYMTDQLGTHADGKKRSITESKFTEVTAFLETFAARNLTNDDELAGYVTQARQMLAGVEVSSLRGPKSDNARDALRGAFDKLKTDIAANIEITIQPKRKIALDEDEI